MWLVSIWISITVFKCWTHSEIGYYKTLFSKNSACWYVFFPNLIVTGFEKSGLSLLRLETISKSGWGGVMHNSISLCFTTEKNIFLEQLFWDFKLQKKFSCLLNISFSIYISLIMKSGNTLMWVKRKPVKFFINTTPAAGFYINIPAILQPILY